MATSSDPQTPIFFNKKLSILVLLMLSSHILTDDISLLSQVEAARHHPPTAESSLFHQSSNSTKRHQKWVGPSGFLSITVALHGGADFTSVQAAVDSVPENNTKNVVIQISAGCYKEKVVVPQMKPYITFIGEGMNSTMIEWHDRASDRGANGEQLRTYRTASVTVYANFFKAKNISFKNTAPAPLPGMEGRQAAAFRISGDKAYFSGCGFYGAQDTLCDDAGRHYFKNCYIQGSIDFIFGNGRSMYKDCQLHSIAKRFGSIAAQDRNWPDEKTGFSFVNCRVTGSGPLYVGRAMGQYSRIVYSYTYFDDVVAHGGWDDWDHTSNKNKYKLQILFFSFSIYKGVKECRTFYSYKLILLTKQDCVFRSLQMLGAGGGGREGRVMGTGARV
uniref:Pectinesterase n=1 Tax=Kalanchoe fedtschenkoi TaxID=63787 RepID=A0A7N1A9L4_KALFE